MNDHTSDSTTDPMQPVSASDDTAKLSSKTSQTDSQSQDPPHFDPTNFSTEPYVRRIDKPWGYEIHWVPDGLPYMGKILHINEGQQLSLQVHDQKQESYYMSAGQAALIWENSRGELVETKLEYGKGYRTAIGQQHRLKGLTDGCDIIEVSTPEAGTTWRLADDFARPNQTPEERDAEYAANNQAV